MEDTDEIEVARILLQLPVLIAESVSRRYCFRGNWGIRKRRSTRLPKPVKSKASGSQKNPKRKGDSGNAKDDSDKTKAINLCLKERIHDNHVAPPGIQMIERKSVTANNGANLTTAQGGLNNVEKSKGKVVSTARKALADISNVQGNSSSNAVHDGDKLIQLQEPDIRKLKNCTEEGTQVMNNHEECKRKQLEMEEKVTKMQKQIDMITALLM